MDESLVIHGFAVFVEPGRVFVEVDEGVEEAAFVKFAIGHGAQGVQVAGPPPWISQRMPKDSHR